MSRQNFYKQRKQRRKRQVDEDLVLQLVARERAIQPKLGARKLLILIGSELEEADVQIGRDRFFDLLSRHDLLIPRKRKGHRTTNSLHGFRVYTNLLKDKELTSPHQAYVCDITYIRTDEGFVYLALVMDAFSRAIVGYDSSDSLEAIGAERAIAMGLKQCPDANRVIHHSDRGVQYCCGSYVGRLNSSGMQISMTEENHCYENAQAERLNGILKQEYGLGGTIRSKSDAYALVHQAVYLYNERRPHKSLGYAFPMEIHRLAA